MHRKSSSSKPHGARPHGAKPHGAPRMAQHQVRIIGGGWKRTLLPVVDALGLRPTPDRVRETVFNWINHQLGGDWDAATVLDLYAGSGALGFEAASRGAAAVTMVDSHGPAVRQLEANRDKLEAGNITILRADALVLARDLATRGLRFDVIFLDPPYQQELLSKTLPLCAALLKEGGMVYAEAEAPLAPEAIDAPEWLAGWEVVRADKAGMVYYHLLKPLDRAA